MSRGGRNKTPDEPERKCLATGEVQPKAGLIRFVTGPDGQVVPDLAAKLPGRGYYVSADRAALERAVSKRLFARGAKQGVTVPDDLVAQVEAGLLRRTTDLLSLARKAGLAVAGYEKARGMLESGEAVLLVQSSDGSTRGKTKLRPPEGAPGEVTHVTVLTAHEMGLSFAREHVIHAALAAGGLTERFREAATRLDGVRQKEGGDSPALKG